MDIQAQHARTIFPITLSLRAQIILHSSLPELLHITEELPRQLLVLLGFFLHSRARSIYWLTSSARQKVFDLNLEQSLSLRCKENIFARESKKWIENITITDSLLFVLKMD
jgi:hypothetical protein